MVNIKGNCISSKLYEPYFYMYSSDFENDFSKKTAFIRHENRIRSYKTLSSLNVSKAKNFNKRQPNKPLTLYHQPFPSRTLEFEVDCEKGI